MRFNPVECGKRMKALRESKNLTQMQLAEQLNISLNHVKALEHARRLFSIDLVIEISAFLMYRWTISFWEKQKAPATSTLN